MKSAKFSPYDILSKTGNLLLFQCTKKYFTEKNNRRTYTYDRNRETRKVVAHSSGLQKLENSNLKILKFEARFAYAVKFSTDFFDLKSAKFSPYDILSKLGNLLCFDAALSNIIIYFISQ